MTLMPYKIVVDPSVDGEDQVKARFSSVLSLSESQLRRLKNMTNGFLPPVFIVFDQARVDVVREKAALGLIFDGKCRKPEPSKPRLSKPSFRSQRFLKQRFWEMSEEDLIIDAGRLTVDIACVSPLGILKAYEVGALSLSDVAAEIIRSAENYSHPDPNRVSDIMDLMFENYPKKLPKIIALITSRREARAANHSPPPSR